MAVDTNKVKAKAYAELRELYPELKDSPDDEIPLGQVFELLRADPESSFHVAGGSKKAARINRRNKQLPIDTTDQMTLEQASIGDAVTNSFKAQGVPEDQVPGLGQDFVQARDQMFGGSVDSSAQAGLRENMVSGDLPKDAPQAGAISPEEVEAFLALGDKVTPQQLQAMKDRVAGRLAVLTAPEPPFTKAQFDQEREGRMIEGIGSAFEAADTAAGVVPGISKLTGLSQKARELSTDVSEDIFERPTISPTKHLKEQGVIDDSAGTASRLAAAVQETAAELFLPTSDAETLLSLLMSKPALLAIKKLGNVGKFARSGILGSEKASEFAEKTVAARRPFQEHSAALGQAKKARRKLTSAREITREGDELSREASKVRKKVDPLGPELPLGTVSEDITKQNSKFAKDVEKAIKKGLNKTDAEVSAISTQAGKPDLTKVNEKIGENLDAAKIAIDQTPEGRSKSVLAGIVEKLSGKSGKVGELGLEATEFVSPPTLLELDTMQRSLGKLAARQPDKAVARSLFQVRSEMQDAVKKGITDTLGEEVGKKKIKAIFGSRATLAKRSSLEASETGKLLGKIADKPELASKLGRTGKAMRELRKVAGEDVAKTVRGQQVREFIAAIDDAATGGPTSILPEEALAKEITKGGRKPKDVVDVIGQDTLTKLEELASAMGADKRKFQQLEAVWDDIAKINAKSRRKIDIKRGKRGLPRRKGVGGDAPQRRGLERLEALGGVSALAYGIINPSFGKTMLAIGAVGATPEAAVRILTSKRGRSLALKVERLSGQIGEKAALDRLATFAATQQVGRKAKREKINAKNIRKGGKK